MAEEPARRELRGRSAPGRYRRSSRRPDGEVHREVRRRLHHHARQGHRPPAGYAALLTRDGLEVVEPLTRRVLWTRRDITERTQLYGDARYIVLVETDSQPPAGRGASCSARWTGMVVEGSGDSGRVLAERAGRTRSSAATLSSPRAPASSRASCASSTSAPARTCGSRSTTRRPSRSSRTTASGRAS